MTLNPSYDADTCNFSFGLCNILQELCLCNILQELGLCNILQELGLCNILQELWLPIIVDFCLAGSIEYSIINQLMPTLFTIL